MAFEDRTLVCRDCGSSFIFGSGEQEFYQSRGLVHEPSRCPSCRSERRKTGFRSDEARTMYPASCASCGKESEVPFQPRQGRPVYCNDCFRSIGASRSF